MADKFQNLINAALTEDRGKVDKAIADAKFTFLELLSLPSQFDALPAATKADLARAYQDNPNLIPDGAKPAVEKALQGVEPAPAKVASLPPASVPATASATAAAPIPPESVPVTQSTLDFIMQREGFAPRAYKDGDHYSIGYGTYATAAEVKSGAPIGEQDAQQRLAREAGQAAAYVDSLGGKLTDNQRTALISMAFNVGTFGPGLTSAIQSGDPDAIAAMMDKYRGAKDPAMSAGVSNRRSEEIALFKSAAPAGGTQVAAAYAPVAKVVPAAAAVNAIATGTAPPPVRNVTPPTPVLRPADLSQLAADVTDGRRYAKGASGSDVRELQHFLNQTGATDDRGRPLKEDGVFGVLTRQAVKDFQGTHPELVKDGIVGPRTLAAMEQDQAKLQQAAAERPMNQDEAPKILGPLAVTDPISDRMTQPGAIDLAGSPTAALMRNTSSVEPIYSPPAIYADNIGRNIGGYVANPGEFLKSAAANGAGSIGGVGGYTMGGGFSLHPGEQQSPTGAGRQAYAELTLGRDQPSDVYRSMMGYGPALGPGTNTNTGEIVYNATAAAARRLMEGPPPGADETQAEPVRFFIPPPEALPDATAGSPDPTSVDDPFPLRSPMVPNDPTSVDDPFPQRSSFPPPDPTSVDDPFPQRAPFDPQPSLTTDDASTLFDPQPYDPSGSGSLADNLTDPLGGAAG